MHHRVTSSLSHTCSMLAVKKCMSFSYHEGSPTFIPASQASASRSTWSTWSRTSAVRSPIAPDPVFGCFRCFAPCNVCHTVCVVHHTVCAVHQCTYLPHNACAECVRVQHLQVPCNMHGLQVPWPMCGALHTLRARSKRTGEWQCFIPKQPQTCARRGRRARVLARVEWL